MGCRYSFAVAICCEGCCLCTRIDIAAALDDRQFRFSRCCAWMRRSWPWIIVSDSLWSLDKLYMWTCKNHAPALRGTDPARRGACFPRIYYKNWRMMAFRGGRERERKGDYSSKVPTVWALQASHVAVASSWDLGKLPSQPPYQHQRVETTKVQAQLLVYETRKALHGIAIDLLLPVWIIHFTSKSAPAGIPNTLEYRSLSNKQKRSKKSVPKEVARHPSCPDRWIFCFACNLRDLLIKLRLWLYASV